MRKYIVLIIAFLVVAGNHLVSTAMTVEEIVNKASRVSYYQADDGKAKVSMTITDSRGRTRQREMTILRLDLEDNGQQKYYVYFDKPGDIKGMTYLVWKQPDKDDDRWLYLPALDLIRRVASSDKRASFAGSHFAYEEISGRSPEEDIHSLEDEDEVFYEIKSVPKNPGSVEFSYYLTWVDKKDFLPKKAELYDNSGKLYKILEAWEVKDVQGFPTVTKIKAENLESGGNTVSEFYDIEYNIGLKDEIFSERSLRRPPRKYIK